MCGMTLKDRSTELKTAALALAMAMAVQAPHQTLAQSRSNASHMSSGSGGDVPATSGPLIAVVSLRNQKLNVFDKNGLVASAPVSSGQRGFETPEGVFSILQKEEEHFSNLYDDAAMPFMQRLTWSGVALHAGALPGRPASHGCIRLPHSFAERLFKMTRLHTRVVVTPHETAPVPIAHAALFQPFAVETVAVARPPDGGAPAPSGLTPADPSSAMPMMLGVSLARPDAPDESAQSKPALVKRSEVLALKTGTAVQAAAASNAAHEARLKARILLGEQVKTDRMVRAIDVQVRRAEGRAAMLEKQLAAAGSEAAAEKARLERAQILAEAASLTKNAEELKAASASKAEATKDVAERARVAQLESAAAALKAREAARLAEPISVFISRKTGRLYIRRHMQTVAEMPVTIIHPERPIGTHVFTVMDADEGGDELRWTVVSVQQSDATMPSRAGTGSQAAPRVTPDAQLKTGLAALDRLVLSTEAIEKVAPFLQPGSTLLISDLGLSIETGRGTDFIVQTRGEEQAIASIAKFVAKKKAELAGEMWPRPRRRRNNDD